MLKTLDDDATSSLIAKDFDNQQMPRIPKIPDLQHTDEQDLIISIVEKSPLLFKEQGPEKETSERGG